MIISKCTNENADQITLDDCLACSGCISSNEKYNYISDKHILDTILSKVCFIISPYVKLNLFSKLGNNNWELFEKKIVQWIKIQYKAIMVVDTSYFNTKGNNVIGTECPGVVLYVEKMFPHLLPYLSTTKSKLQLAIEYLQTLYRDTPIIALQQCYDKKDEIIKENYSNVYLIGLKDIKIDKIDLSIVPSNDLNEWEKSKQECLDSIEGLNNSLSFFKTFIPNKFSKTQNIFICNNGCFNGPALLKNQNIFMEKIVYFKLPHNSTIWFSSSARSFKIKTKNFNIEW